MPITESSLPVITTDKFFSVLGLKSVGAVDHPYMEFTLEEAMYLAMVAADKKGIGKGRDKLLEEVGNWVGRRIQPAESGASEYVAFLTDRATREVAGERILQDPVLSGVARTLTEELCRSRGFIQLVPDFPFKGIAELRTPGVVGSDTFRVLESRVEGASFLNIIHRKQALLDALYAAIILNHSKPIQLASTLGEIKDRNIGNSQDRVARYKVGLMDRIQTSLDVRDHLDALIFERMAKLIEESALKRQRNGRKLPVSRNLFNNIALIELPEE